MALPLTLRRAARDLALPLAIAALLIAVMAAASLLAPAGLRSPATALSGAAVVLLAFLRWPRPALIVFALFMLVYDSFSLWIGVGVHQLDELVIPGLVVIAAWRQQPWRRRGVFEPLRDGALLAVVLLAVVASLVNGVPAITWLIGLLLLVKAVAFLHVVLWHDWSADDVRQALTTVFAFALVVLAIGFLEAIVGPRLREWIGLPQIADVRGQFPGISSIMRFTVLFSWFTAFVALFLLAYLVYRRLWLLLAALAFGAGTFLSGRRRAIIGLAVALMGGALAQLRLGVSRRTLARVWLPIGGVALVLVIVFLPGLTDLAKQTLIEYGGPLPVLTEPGQPQTPGQIDYVNGNPRLLLYVTSVDVARDFFPLGAGLGRYASPMSRIDFSPLYARYGLDRIWGLTPEYDAYITDTFWPHVLGEIGVFGLVGYLVFIGALGVGLWRATRLLHDPFTHAFALAALMAFIHAGVESLASSMYESPPRIYLAFGAVAIALALARAARGRIIASEVVEG